MPMTTQIIAVTKRCFLAYWRTPDYIAGKIALHIVTALFNAFIFWRLSQGTTGMENRVFSIFLNLTIAPPLIQQLQPRYLEFQNIFSSRESKSKIYSSVAFSFAVVLVELPYSTVAGTLYWACWYWGPGFPTSTFCAAFSWMLMLIFEIYYVSLGQMIASVSPNAFFASLLVPLFFIFVVSFCGVVVPYAALPHFWQSWMYVLVPFRYLLEAFIGTLLHDVPVRCLADEVARFTPPNGTPCLEYTRDTVSRLGGYVEDQNGVCAYCQLATGDEFARSLNIFYVSRWRDYGIVSGSQIWSPSTLWTSLTCSSQMWLYCGFQIGTIFFATYMLVFGIQDIKARLNAQRARLRTANA